MHFLIFVIVICQDVACALDNRYGYYNKLIKASHKDTHTADNKTQSIQSAILSHRK